MASKAFSSQHIVKITLDAISTCKNKIEDKHKEKVEELKTRYGWRWKIVKQGFLGTRIGRITEIRTDEEIWEMYNNNKHLVWDNFYSTLTNREWYQADMDEHSDLTALRRIHQLAASANNIDINISDSEFNLIKKYLP